MTTIGVDPGCVATGWAVIRDGALVACGTLRTGNVSSALVEIARTHNCQVAGVQVPCVRGKRAPFFRRIGRMALVRHAQLCGEIVGALRAGGITVLDIAPQDCRGATKRRRTYWLAAWNWRGRTPSEHARDAAEIARIAHLRLRLAEMTP